MAVDPLWKRAPLLLTSHVGAGLAVAAAVLVLTVASASSRLLVSSAGSAAFTRLQQTALTRADGVVATGEGPATAEGIFGVDALLRRELGDLPGLARPTMSLAGMQFQRTPDATGVERADGSVITATLFHRDELLPFVQAQPGSEGSGDGLWLPDTVADQARLGPGDEATLASVTAADGEPVTVSVPIDGIYRDPFDDGLLPADAADTWMDVRDRVPRDEESTRVPPLLLAGRDAFIEHTRALGDRVSATWNVPLADPSMSLAHAEALSADLDGFFARAGDPTGATVATISEFARPGEFDADTTLPASVEQANAVAATLTPPSGSLALAAQAVALVLVGAAVAMLLRRRHHELRLLGAQGASPLDTGLRVALEILPAAAVGAVSGWLLAAPLIRALGPSPHLDPSAVAASRGAAVVALLGASLVAAGVGVVFAWGGLRSSPSVTHRPRWIPWEPVALALAAAAGYQLLVRSDGTRGEPGAINLLVVAFPLLAIAALVGLAVRALARGLPALATIWPSRLPFVLWIATRRVARLPAHALTLVGTGGMALGLFVYFCALATSSGSALDAKSAALAGAETTSRLFTTWRIEPGLPRSMPDDTTFVWRDSATIEPGDIRVDVLAVDPETFGQGAAWRPTFADAPLDAVLREAGAAPSTGPDTAAVIAVGDTAEGQTLPDTGQLISGGWGAIGFEVVTRPEAFPGMQENIPLVVVDARRFFSLIGPYDPTDPETQVNPIRQVFRPEIWSAGAPAHVERYLAGRDTPLLDVETRRRIATRPDLLAPSWALSHLVALGTAIGALALGALFVYADQRRVQRATSYALARRMGLSQRTNVAATALEMLAVLAVAFVVGVGAALLIGAAVAGSVDPVPLLAPAPQLQVPVTAIGLAALISVLAAAAASAWLQLRAERTDVAEVLRVAE